MRCDLCLQDTVATRAALPLAWNSHPALFLRHLGSKLMRDEEDGLFDRCNGTPAFLAPEMMEPHARYR